MYYDSLYGGVDRKAEDYDTEMEYMTNKKMLLNIEIQMLNFMQFASQLIFLSRFY